MNVSTHLDVSKDAREICSSFILKDRFCFWGRSKLFSDVLCPAPTCEHEMLGRLDPRDVQFFLHLSQESEPDPCWSIIYTNWITIH